jgi:hypothetical protein
MLKRINAISILVLAALIVMWVLFFKFILSNITFVDSSLSYYGVAIIIIFFLYFMRSSSNIVMSKKENALHMSLSAVLFIVGFVFCYTMYRVTTGVVMIVFGILHFFWASGDNPSGNFIRNICFTLVLYTVGILLCFRGLWAFVGIIAAFLGYLGMLKTIKNYEMNDRKLFKVLNIICITCLVIFPILGILSM